MNQSNFVVLTTPQELENLIQNAVKDAFENLQSQVQNSELPQKDFLNVQEAASFLNLAVPTLYSLVSRRELPSNKIGKKLSFKRTDLIALLESGRRSTRKEIMDLAQNSLQKPQLRK
jgi:excisionase family DNA binding protein